MTFPKRTSLNYADLKILVGGPQSQDSATLNDYRLSQVALNPNFRLKTNEYIEESPWQLSYFLEHLLLESDVLGSGGFGVVHKATLKLPSGTEVKCVAKFNKTLIERGFITLVPQPNGLYQCTLNETLLKSHSDVFQQSLQSSIQEYENAVSVLNPYRNDPNLFETSNTTMKTYALKKISNHSFKALAAKVQENERHPGFIHMHKILHFEPQIACLLSEFCEGTLLDQIFMNVNTFRGPTNQVKMQHVPPCMISFRLDHPAFLGNFMNLSTQMASAIAYLRDVVRISHIDIKPENIMYIPLLLSKNKTNQPFSENGTRPQSNQDDASSLLWKLCDFGLMKPFSSDASPAHFQGTAMYMPPNLRTQQAKFSGMNVMIYQYACVLFETLLSGMDYHQISPSWNAGRELDWGHFYFHTFAPYVRKNSVLIGKLFHPIPFLTHFMKFFLMVFHPRNLKLYLDIESDILQTEFQNFYTLLLLQKARTSLH